MENVSSFVVIWILTPLDALNWTLSLLSGKDCWDREAVIALPCHEETTGTLGSGYLLDNARSPLAVRIGETGLIWVELTSNGKPAHGAHVHMGVNAINLLLRALKALKCLEWKPLKANEDVKIVIQTV
ncbi:unnamed protein product [Clonostachys rosea f. rosea IK726]|nr:unnamed protein product [Clonostachys rosea f. rosea IK726]